MTVLKGRWLGIDIGSTAVKAATFDKRGRQLAVARLECPSEGEKDPEDWWRATVEALRRLDLANVGAVSVCGRGGTNVLLGEGGRVDAPSWDDRRAHAEYREVAEKHPGLSRAPANLLAKARWWEKWHGPVSTAFTAKDYVVFRLTGAIVSDSASGGVPGLPPLVEPMDPWATAGTSTRAAAAETGLAAGTVVAVGWHDGSAAVFGAGAAERNTAAITLGTNAVYRIVTDRLPPGLPHYWDLTPGLTVTGGDITAAGRAFAWAQALFPGADMGRSRPGASGAVFLPQTAGRIAPDANRAARAAWHGLDASQTTDDLLRAVVEGIACSLRQVREHLAGGGLAATCTVATGGGARHPEAAQILADVLQRAVQVATSEEGCRGAALLGAVAAGGIALEEARTMRPDYQVYEPRAETQAVYNDVFERFLRFQAATDEAYR